MTTSNVLNPLPTRSQLLKATAIAIVVAALVLITTVLPAEFGIDPTGIGKRLGVLGMSAGDEPVADAQAPAAPAAATPGPVVSPNAALMRNGYVTQSATPFRSEQRSVTLGPNQGAEIKARMREGEHFTFSWSSDGGAVEFDMHGEKVNAAKDEFTSYWLADAASAAGTFTAPFEGVHGWYWHNAGTAPVTVTVQVSGFYSELFRP
jgi:hypothetical protein